MQLKRPLNTQSVRFKGSLRGGSTELVQVARARMPSRSFQVLAIVVPLVRNLTGCDIVQNVFISQRMEAESVTIAFLQQLGMSASVATLVKGSQEFMVLVVMGNSTHTVRMMREGQTH